MLGHHHLTVYRDLATQFGQRLRTAIGPATPAASANERPLIRVGQCGAVDQRLPTGKRRLHGAQILRRIGIKSRSTGWIAVYVAHVSSQVTGAGDRVSHLMGSRIRPRYRRPQNRCRRSDNHCQTRHAPCADRFSHVRHDKERYRISWPTFWFVNRQVCQRPPDSGRKQA